MGPVELSPGDLIVIDEASMFSNPDLGDIVDYAARAGVKVAIALDQAYVAHTLEGKDSLLVARSHELRRGVCRRVRGELQHLGLVARDSPTIEIADGSRQAPETAAR